MLARDGETFQGNDKFITLFFNFSAGIAPVRRNAKKLIAADIPAQTDMFYIT